MKDLLKRFWMEEDGMGTVEVVIIVAVLVGVALIFKDGITNFAKKLMEKFFNPNSVSVDYSGDQTLGTGNP